MSRYTVVPHAQRSPEWFAARCGLLTGSRAAAMLARGKYGLEASTRRLYRKQLVYERYTGAPMPDPPTTVEMRRGIGLEPTAIAAYMAETGASVTRTGFLRSRAHLAGCSLDGLLEDGAGILEVKAPNTTTHVRYLQEGRLPPEHRAQMRHNLWISGARYGEFVSFDDRVAPRWQLFVVRVEAADLELPAYEQHAIAFLLDVETELRGVERLLGPRPSGLVIHRRD